MMSEQMGHKIYLTSKLAIKGSPILFGIFDHYGSYREIKENGRRILVQVFPQFCSGKQYQGFRLRDLRQPIKHNPIIHYHAKKRNYPRLARRLESS